MADYPFYDKQPGPERREKLNELYAAWEAAMGNVVKGDKGWSPLIRAVADGERAVLQLYDWTGGQGTKPTQTGYLGATGYVSDISLAIDFRGPIGTQGNPGPANTLSIGTVSSGTNASATITGTSPSQVLSLVLPKGDTGDQGPKGDIGETGPQGLKGDKGDKGDTGDTGGAATISVGSVTTGGAGTSASVDNSGTSSAAILNFTIPRGDKGEQGIQGVQGLQGVAGDAATIAVGTVTTGAAGTQVEVVNVGSPSAAVFDFTIPKGQDGAGAGDMLKADYDSVGDGVVNAARAVPWDGITEKPVVIASGATSADARAVIDAVSSGELTTGLNGKVDKVAGKGLSTNDYTNADKAKLAGIAADATKNSSDSELLNRANHTGTQAISTVTNLQDALDTKVESLALGSGNSVGVYTFQNGADTYYTASVQASPETLVMRSDENGGTFETPTPVNANDAANKGYVDGQINTLNTSVSTALGLKANIANPVLKAEKTVASNITSTVIDASVSGFHYKAVTSGTIFSFSNPPGANSAQILVVELEMQASAVVSFLGAVWDGAAPTLTNGMIHTLVFYYCPSVGNRATSWRGFMVGKGIARV